MKETKRHVKDERNMREEEIRWTRKEAENSMMTKQDEQKDERNNSEEKWIEKKNALVDNDLIKEQVLLHMKKTKVRYILKKIRTRM